MLPVLSPVQGYPGIWRAMCRKRCCVGMSLRKRKALAVPTTWIMIQYQDWFAFEKSISQIDFWTPSNQDLDSNQYAMLRAISRIQDPKHLRWQKTEPLQGHILTVSQNCLGRKWSEMVKFILWRRSDYTSIESCRRDTSSHDLLFDHQVQTHAFESPKSSLTFL